MTIKVGDKLPQATFTVMGADGPKPITSDELFSGKTVALFAVPGAFTPTCSAKHLPGFKEKAAELKAKGVDTIACVSVNDVFVMNAWGSLSPTLMVMRAILFWVGLRPIALAARCCRAKPGWVASATAWADHASHGQGQALCGG